MNAINKIKKIINSDYETFKQSIDNIFTLYKNKMEQKRSFLHFLKKISSEINDLIIKNEKFIKYCYRADVRKEHSERNEDLRNIITSYKAKKADLIKKHLYVEKILNSITLSVSSSTRNVNSSSHSAGAGGVGSGYVSFLPIVPNSLSDGAGSGYGSSPSTVPSTETRTNNSNSRLNAPKSCFGTNCAIMGGKKRVSKKKDTKKKVTKKRVTKKKISKK